MGHHDDEHEHTTAGADEPATEDGTDPNQTVVSDDIDQEMLRDDLAER